MRKKIYTGILTGILVMVHAVTAFANRPVHVALDGFLQELNHGASLIEGRSMIDADDAQVLFGDLVLRVDATGVDGRDMLPIRDVANIMSFDIIWDDENSLVRLSSANADYSLLPQVTSGIQPTISMTYQAALNLINDRDARLIAMEENMIILEREKREIDDYLSDNRIRGRARRNYTLAEVQMLRAREALRNQQHVLEINEGLIRAGNELQLRNAIADIGRAQLDIVLFERQLLLEKRSTAIVELMHELGLETDAAQRDARASLERTRTNLENLQTAQGSNHLTLNTLLGLSATAIVEIQGLSWTIAARTPLEGHIATQLANAPNLALLQLDLDYVEYIYFSYDVLLKSSEQEDDYRYRGRRQDASIVIEMRNDINVAERALENATNNLESRIRSLHNDIEAVLEQQTIAQSDLAVAIENYQEAMLRYMTGMGTWLELERAKLAILNHEITLARLEINLGMLTLLYQHPYLG